MVIRMDTCEPALSALSQVSMATVIRIKILKKSEMNSLRKEISSAVRK